MAHKISAPTKIIPAKTVVKKIRVASSADKNVYIDEERKINMVPCYTNFGDVEKNTYTTTNVKQLKAIYSLLAEEKVNVLSATTQADQIFFGQCIHKRYENDQWKTTVRNKGIEMPGKWFDVITNRGIYKFSVPENTIAMELFCKLLSIECDQKKDLKPIRSFLFGADIFNAMKKAIKFCVFDDLRPVFGTVLIEIRENKLQVIATDAHKIYISRTFDVPGPAGSYEYLIHAKDISRMKQAKGGQYEFVEYKNGKVLLMEKVVGLFTGVKFPNYRVVMPQYSNGVRLFRNDLAQKIKEVLPFTNKSTSGIVISVNGDIRVSGQDIDFSFAGNSRMNYIKKEIPDCELSFNGKFALTVLKALESDEITLMTNGRRDMGVIFTDGRDQALLMPLIN